MRYAVISLLLILVLLAPSISAGTIEWVNVGEPGLVDDFFGLGSHDYFIELQNQETGEKIAVIQRGITQGTESNILWILPIFENPAALFDVRKGGVDGDIVDCYPNSAWELLEVTHITLKVSDDPATSKGNCKSAGTPLARDLELELFGAYGGITPDNKVNVRIKSSLIPEGTWRVDASKYPQVTEANFPAATGTPPTSGTSDQPQPPTTQTGTGTTTPTTTPPITVTTTIEAGTRVDCSDDPETVRSSVVTSELSGLAGELDNKIGDYYLCYVCGGDYCNPLKDDQFPSSSSYESTPEPYFGSCTRAVQQANAIVADQFKVDASNAPYSFIQLCANNEWSLLPDRTWRPSEICAIMKQESTFNPEAGGDAENSLGLMQVSTNNLECGPYCSLDSTGSCRNSSGTDALCIPDFYNGVVNNGAGANQKTWKIAKYNTYAGTYLLKTNYERELAAKFNACNAASLIMKNAGPANIPFSHGMTIAAYNTGAGNVSCNSIPEQTLNHTASVLAFARIYEENASSSSPDLCKPVALYSSTQTTRPTPPGPVSAEELQCSSVLDCLVKMGKRFATDVFDP